MPPALRERKEIIRREPSKTLLYPANGSHGKFQFAMNQDNIYYRLSEWGYQHQTVCHSKSEYARDEDGDGFHEIHVNTMEGVWSLLRSWLRPHRGVSQENLPLLGKPSRLAHLNPPVLLFFASFCPVAWRR